jgi:hypothetical protein
MYALGSMGARLDELRAYVDMRMRAAIARLVHFTYFSGNSATGTQDNVECDHSDPDAGNYLVRRMQHFGFRSRPPSGVAAIRLGNFEAAGNSVVVAEDSERYGPGDLNDGEVAIYNKQNGTEIRLDAQGNIKITAGSGANVVVNGGNADVGRVGDQVQVTIPTGSFLVGATGGTFNPAPVTVNGTITAGAPNFKA